MIPREALARQTARDLLKELAINSAPLPVDQIVLAKGLLFEERDGFPAGVFGALLFVGLVFERWRYKPLTDTRLGPEWVATDERFVDPETGKLVTVFYHPATGERRYVTP